MHSISRRFVVLASAIPALASVASAQSVNFHKADLIRVSGAYVLGAEVSPNWMDDSVRFWFKSTGSKDANSFYLVDPRAGTKTLLFDHSRMAAALSTASDTLLDPSKFPTFRLVNDGKTLRVTLKKKMLHCEIANYSCVVPDTIAVTRAEFAKTGPEWASRSPDKQWDVFSWNHNIYVRPASLSNSEFATKQDSAARDTAKKAGPRKPDPDSLPLPSGSVQ